MAAGDRDVLNVDPSLQQDVESELRKLALERRRAVFARFVEDQRDIDVAIAGIIAARTAAIEVDRDHRIAGAGVPRP
jgi:RecB family exonuclease